MEGRSGAITAEEIRRRYPGSYTGMHAPRYATILEQVGTLALPAAPRVLAVGPSAFTILLHEALGVPVDTIGIDSLDFAGKAAAETGGRHTDLDLNETAWPERWPTDLGPYDLVVFAEVIEHLHLSPEYVLRFLGALLDPGRGGYLVIQTPNAVALGKRVRLLLGRNPYDLINPDLTNPLHFREYTRGELEQFVGGAGLELVSLRTAAYFDSRFRTGKNQVVGTVQNAVYRYLPASLRAGITLVARRPPDASADAPA